jgi:hypothetical protein
MSAAVDPSIETPDAEKQGIFTQFPPWMEDQSHPYTEVVRNGLNFWYLKPKPGYGIVFGVRGKADTTAGLAGFCSAYPGGCP